MPDPRNDEQRRRLADEYARKTDTELEILAEQGASLTDAARQVLRAEIFRRSLTISVSEGVASPALAPLLPIVRVYRDLLDALIAQSVLDSAGINCFLFDENIVRLNWLRSYAVHCIKLRVPDEDAPDAAQLLDPPRLESFDVEGIGEYVEPHCPTCESLDISFRPLIKPIAYGFLFLNLAIPVKHPAWRCSACGHQWRTGKPGEHLALNWNLIRFLWVVGLMSVFASRMVHFGPLASWLWIAYAAMSAVCVARFAADRILMNAFLVGLFVDAWRFVVWSGALRSLFDHQVPYARAPLFAVFVIGENAVIAGAIGGIGLMIFTRLAMFVVPRRKSSAPA